MTTISEFFPADSPQNPHQVPPVFTLPQPLHPSIPGQYTPPYALAHDDAHRPPHISLKTSRELLPQSIGVCCVGGSALVVVIILTTTTTATSTGRMQDRQHLRGGPSLGTPDVVVEFHQGRLTCGCYERGA